MSPLSWSGSSRSLTSKKSFIEESDYINEKEILSENFMIKENLVGSARVITVDSVPSYEEKEPVRSSSVSSELLKPFDNSFKCLLSISCNNAVTI